MLYRDRKFYRRSFLRQQNEQKLTQNVDAATAAGTCEKGHDENGRQDDRGSDDSSLSSPASQGSGEFGEAKDPSGLVNDTAKEISDHVTQGLGPKNGIERGKDDKKNSVDLASQDACGNSIKEITPVAKPEKTEHAETSTHSNLVNNKSDGTKEYPSPEKDNGKVAATLPGSPAGTSRNVESILKSEVPVSSEEKLAESPVAVIYAASLVD